MQTITVIIRDNHPGYYEPLIYTVQVNDPNNADEVLQAVTVQRAADTGEDEDDLDLDLMFAFAGDLNTVADWRE